MKTQVKAKIFLAEERGLNETGWFRSQNTFNLPTGQAGFGKYNNEHKQPFGDVYVLNDDMLAGERSLSMLIEENSYIILLPVSGAVVCKQQNNNSTLVVAGQLLVQAVEASKIIEMSDPFKNDAVNFMQIWIRANRKDSLNTGALTYPDVNMNLNKLNKIFPGTVLSDDLPFSISIGKFSGRGETIHKSRESGCFLFVLNGAFEAEGCLLHERDGLALWDTNEIEIEALSNDAMMLVIETKV